MVPYAAYLRVYEPVEALPRRPRPVGDTDAPVEPHLLTRAEQERSLHAAVRAEAVGLVDGGDTAYWLERGGKTFVAPGDELLRSWLSLTRLAGGLPPSVARALTPGSVVVDADEALRNWRREHPEAAPHVRDATWRLPLPWLLLAAPEEQEAYTAGGQPSTRYLTPMVQARRRVARAHAAARRHFQDTEELAELTDVGRWLESFHAHSWVELDLAGLGAVVRELDAEEPDRSLRELAAAVRALREDRVDDSAAAYQKVTAWWGLLALREHAN